MKPVVILDSNALHGRNPFMRSPLATLLALSEARRIRLIVPEVVLLELARQSVELLERNANQIRSSLKEFNDSLRDTGTEGVSISLPTRARADFYNFAQRLLRQKGVEIPSPPAVPIEDLLRRDLDARKPFARDGKGFRDALIWETIRDLCSTLADTTTTVILVTNNHADFCASNPKALHPDLQSELAAELKFDVVASPYHAQTHKAVGPLVESLRAVKKTLTRVRVEALVDTAITDLHGRELQDFAVYAGDGLFESPINSALDEAAFEEIVYDSASIGYDIYHIGEDGYSIQVTVDAEVSFSGFVEKGDYYMSDSGGITLLEDWNRHVFRAYESHRRLRFTLTAVFTEAEVDDVCLVVDEVEEI